MTLAEITSESIGKSIWSIKNFLEEMIKKGELSAKQILITRSRIKLEPTEKIEERHLVILSYQPTTADYSFNTTGYGGCFTEDGDQSQYQNAALKRLAKKFNKRMLTNNFSEIDIPDKFVIAELHASYTDDWRAGTDIDYLDSRTGNLKITGQPDELIERVHEFLRTN